MADPTAMADTADSNTSSTSHERPRPHPQQRARDHAEHQRDREVQRYYQPWLSAQGSALNVALHVDSIAQSDLHGSGYKPKVSQDKALTAFAQLAVLRLGVKRAMVSLIDAKTQMILAEGTRSLCLGNLEPPPSVSSTALANDIAAGLANNELWLGTTILSRPDAVCEYCLTNTYTARDPDGTRHSAAALVIPDCRLDSRFETRPYVVAEPGVRFYAGVPIVTRNGIKIGAYAVSDEKPRDGLSVEELKFMQGVAQAVMEHLEWARDRVDRFKGERIVRGLASFIEGCSSLDEPPAKDEQQPRNAPTAALSSAAESRLPPPRMPSKRPLSRLSSYNRSAESPPAPEKRETPASAKDTTAAQPQKQSSPTKTDSMVRMYNRAAEIVRQSTLADGVVIFGATAGSSREMARIIRAGGLQPSDEDDTAAQAAGSDSVSMDSSDSDNSPSGRPCKILAFSIADERARMDIEKGSALTLGTLEKYFSLFPGGKHFSFTEEGSGVSSEDDSTSDRETLYTKTTITTSFPGEQHETGRAAKRRKARMDHKELLKKIPGAKSVVFLPLFDHMEDKLGAGVFLWTSVTGRMMNLDDDLSYLRAFGNSITSEVARINTQKNEAAKTTFIASMSHELRSPLHGILGAAEFLMETATSSYQSGLVTSISTCGKTLLDTLNHVLDYSKINKLGRAQMRRNAKHNKLINLASDSSTESLNLTAVVDLSVLVEEVVDAITAGHTFKQLPGNLYSGASRSTTTGSTNSISASNSGSDMLEGPVSVLIDICPRASWMVRTQPGALRRIIMNLLGNALKYTSSGFVLVSLRVQQSANGSKADAVMRVVDSGKGMSEEFQRDRLFVPFSQEDSFQPGTGLGLSIVKQIVDSLRGTVDVKSQQGIGTEIVVRLSLPLGQDAATTAPDEEMASIAEVTRGLQLVLLDTEEPPPDPHHPISKELKKLNDTLVGTCHDWFEMKVAREGDAEQPDADLYMYCEPPHVERLKERLNQSKLFSPKNKEVPIVIVCLNAAEAIKISQNQSKVLEDLGKIVEVVPQPVGPRKLAKVFNHCLQRRKDAAANDKTAPTPAVPQSPEAGRMSRLDGVEKQEQTAREHQSEQQNRNNSADVVRSVASPPPLDPETPSLQPNTMKLEPNEQGIAQQRSELHVLLVDDNHINRQLLVMFMKKHKYSYEEAENGQEALDKYKASCLPGPHSTGPSRPFDYVLMDISMPVMNGMDATRHIRDFEAQNGLPRTDVIALTGLASSDAQRDAETVGVDVFMAKPVRFADLKKLLMVKKN